MWRWLVRSRLGLAGMLAASVAVGCFGPTVATPIECGPQGECPAGLFCLAAADPAGPALCLDGTCPDTDTVGQAPCQTDEGIAGLCVAGECHVRGCGDGHVGGGEVCDDGNTAGADGCAATCTKVEQCGDGFLDSYYVEDDDGQQRNLGEACDDANAIETDGCSADCRRTSWTATARSSEADYRTVSLGDVRDMAVDACGVVYAAVPNRHRVLVVDRPRDPRPGCGTPPATLTVRTLVGTGVAGNDLVGGDAIDTRCDSPAGVATNAIGEVYVADTNNRRILRITTERTVELAWPLAFRPYGLAAGTDGVLYVVASDSAQIYRLRPEQVPELVAGNGTVGVPGDLTAATTQPLGEIHDVEVFRDAHDGDAFDGDTLYVADSLNHQLYQINSDGLLEHLAGSGTQGVRDAANGADARFSEPRSLAAQVTADGDCEALYVADAGSRRIRRLTCLGADVTTVAGNDDSGVLSPEAADATTVSIGEVSALVVDGQEVLFEGRTRRFSALAAAPPPASITTLLTPALPDGTFASGLPLPASFQAAERSKAIEDDTGRLLVSLPSHHRVVRINEDGTVDVIAGTGAPGGAPARGDERIAARTPLNRPTDIATMADGSVLIVDSLAHVIRRVQPNGMIDRIAGTGVDGALNPSVTPLVTEARTLALSSPRAVAVAADDAIYVGESGTGPCARIWRIAGGTATRVLGPPSLRDCSPQGVGTRNSLTGTKVRLESLVEIALVGDDLLLRNTGDNYISCVRADGTFRDIASTGFVSFGGGFLAENAASFLVTTSSGLERWSTSASSLCGSSDPLVRTLLVESESPLGAIHDGPLSLMPSGRMSRSSRGVLVGNARGVRLVAPGLDEADLLAGATVTTLLGHVDPPALGRFEVARLSNPVALIARGDGLGMLVAGGTSGTVQAIDPAGQLIRSVAGRYGHQGVAAAPVPDSPRYGGSAYPPIVGLAPMSAPSQFLMVSGDDGFAWVEMVDPDSPASWIFADHGTLFAIPENADEPAPDVGDLSGLTVAGEFAYVADRTQHAVWSVEVNGFAGRRLVNHTGLAGMSPPGLPLADTRLNSPAAVLVCDGDLYIADTGNHRVLAVRDVGTDAEAVELVLGIGSRGQNASGRPASGVAISSPRGLACDERGLFVTSGANVVLVERDAAGEVTGESAARVIYGDVLASGFPAGQTRTLAGIAVYRPDAGGDGFGTVWAADAGTGTLVEIELKTR
jgi:cysteine-rich repeat protein